MNLLLVALGAALACATGGAIAAPVSFGDGWATAIVNDIGSLGHDNDRTALGYDAAGTASFGYDFVSPGSPMEGFAVSSNQGSWASNTNSSWSSSFVPAAPALVGTGGASWSALSRDGGLRLTSSYAFSHGADGSLLSITTRIDNLSGGALTDLAFLRTVDPDQDNYINHDFATHNWLASASEACAYGGASGATICLRSLDATHSGVAGVSGIWSQSPAAYLAGQHDGDGDNAIGVAWALGTLAAGDSVTLSYGYALSASGVTPPVPEPAGVAAMAAGLAGLLALRRRRRG